MKRILVIASAVAMATSMTPICAQAQSVYKPSKVQIKCHQYEENENVKFTDVYKYNKNGTLKFARLDTQNIASFDYYFYYKKGKLNKVIVTDKDRIFKYAKIKVLPKKISVQNAGSWFSTSQYVLDKHGNIISYHGHSYYHPRKEAGKAQNTYKGAALAKTVIHSTYYEPYTSKKKKIGGKTMKRTYYTSGARKGLIKEVRTKENFRGDKTNERRMYRYQVKNGRVIKATIVSKNGKKTVSKAVRTYTYKKVRKNNAHTLPEAFYDLVQ